MIRPTGLALAAFLSLTAASPARADDSVGPSALPEGHPATGEVWYGGRTIAADLIGAVAMVACAGVLGAANTSLTAACPAPYLLAAPIVHGRRGYTGRAVLSFGLHVALPVAGVLIGEHVKSCTGDDNAWCNLPELGVGLLAGMVAAATIDALIAYAPAGPAARSASVSPSVAFTRDGFGLGLVGRF
jgi:hypothetical protein